MTAPEATAAVAAAAAGAAVAAPVRPSAPVPSPAVRAALSLLRVYQAIASARVSPCRFYPSCSNYAVEAFTAHGFWRGLALTGRRLVRCRPFGPHGVDLVPIPVAGHSHSHAHAPAQRLSRLGTGGRSC